MLTQRLHQAKQRISQADFILVGAGAGFSTAAGLTYYGKRFEENFQPFIRHYGMRDMYSAGFYPFDCEEEKWAYWAQHILINRFEPPALPLYRQLLELVKTKNYFVLTTNVDAQFEKAGFAQERLFATQGDYGYLQCATGCHDKLYSNAELVRQWRAQTVELKIPIALVPQCPICSGKMVMHLRIDQHFIENEAWRQAQKRYTQFAQQSLQGSAVYLELGVGYNTPTIIRYPFEQMTFHNRDAVLIRLNRDEPAGYDETKAQTICFTEDPNLVMAQLLA
ncbi:Sir2 silent information regulator family NAD-dependent deacetylase [Chelonobacter oris]|uniref:Sir2 silent information regulator family NAD-dependent deacetylase n=1 Tax=Chelonobacter oris TaxID=505317 RepID=A0A0A3APG7_9PAST|nr:Sir2 family NAD-dependent protein deacetylase [Chelonobacter oris]KGQ69647.1 Sir2 silent information regulator family NAD-dependent deacetylase [Chelonobacter oris]